MAGNSRDNRTSPKVTRELTEEDIRQFVIPFVQRLDAYALNHGKPDALGPVADPARLEYDQYAVFQDKMAREAYAYLTGHKNEHNEQKEIQEYLQGTRDGRRFKSLYNTVGIDFIRELAAIASGRLLQAAQDAAQPQPQPEETMGIDPAQKKDAAPTPDAAAMVDQLRTMREARERGAPRARPTPPASAPADSRGTAEAEGGSGAASPGSRDYGDDDVAEARPAARAERPVATPRGSGGGGGFKMPAMPTFSMPNIRMPSPRTLGAWVGTSVLCGALLVGGTSAYRWISGLLNQGDPTTPPTALSLAGALDMARGDGNDTAVNVPQARGSAVAVMAYDTRVLWAEQATLNRLREAEASGNYAEAVADVLASWQDPAYRAYNDLKVDGIIAVAAAQRGEAVPVFADEAARWAHLEAIIGNANGFITRNTGAYSAFLLQAYDANAGVGQQAFNALNATPGVPPDVPKRALAFLYAAAVELAVLEGRDDLSDAQKQTMLTQALVGFYERTANDPRDIRDTNGRPVNNSPERLLGVLPSGLQHVISLSANEAAMMNMADYARYLGIVPLDAERALPPAQIARAMEQLPNFEKAFKDAFDIVLEQQSKQSQQEQSSRVATQNIHYLRDAQALQELGRGDGMTPEERLAAAQREKIEALAYTRRA